MPFQGIMDWHMHTAMSNYKQASNLTFLYSSIFASTAARPLFCFAVLVVKTGWGPLAFGAL
jgi:hypothetical protein